MACESQFVDQPLVDQLNLSDYRRVIARPVKPMLVPEGHPLDIDGNLNGVLFKTDVARDVTIIGRGAGGLETQSAIYSDLIRISNSL